MKELIYSVEDDVSLGKLIEYTLEGAGYEVCLFVTTESMLEAFSKRPPSLILLDVMLPGMDGLEALSIIRQKYSNVAVKIILLTAKNNEIDKIHGLNNGADDYITKPFSVLELIARVKAHLRRYTTEIAGDILSFQGIKLFLKSRTVTVDNKIIDLTFKEFELLKKFMENAGVVLERNVILRDIWGYEYFGETRTVDIHVKNLRGKLLNYGNCIAGARGLGYILKEIEK